MAAIPRDRRRGVSGRNPNFLLFILTLLSLVCFIRAQSDREMRAMMKEDYQRLRKNLERRMEKYKSQISTSLERMKTFLKNWISMTAMVKKTTAEFPDAFHPMEKILEATKVFLEKAVVYFDKTFEETGEILKKREEDLREFNDLFSSTEMKIQREPESEEDFGSEEEDDWDAKY
ncbi:hypothetical protein AMECASPLE_021417 [Ameca splendens]|uniref:Uncharacterized protein n=1 Tax=Ameca splendens TaxID=208324 RepID=A0ABV0XGJ2_9TELE